MFDLTVFKKIAKKINFENVDNSLLIIKINLVIKYLIEVEKVIVKQLLNNENLFMYYGENLLYLQKLNQIDENFSKSCTNETANEQELLRIQEELQKEEHAKNFQIQNDKKVKRNEARQKEEEEEEEQIKQQKQFEEEENKIKQEEEEFLSKNENLEKEYKNQIKELEDSFNLEKIKLVNLENNKIISYNELIHNLENNKIIKSKNLLLDFNDKLQNSEVLSRTNKDGYIVDFEEKLNENFFKSFNFDDFDASSLIKYNNLPMILNYEIKNLLNEFCKNIKTGSDEEEGIKVLVKLILSKKNNFNLFELYYKISTINKNFLINLKLKINNLINDLINDLKINDLINYQNENEKSN
jgi:flagellar biosynthesis GTPase FlhF